jgi:ubiquinone/menaquinone biosynthesis C-methylase UbiE
MHAAFKVWDTAGESLESIEARIHDGVPRHQLLERAAGFAVRVLSLPPWLELRPEDTVVEVGPGVGYVMQALAEQSGVAHVTGLDVAAAMADFGRARIRRDGLSADRFRFELYDGVTFPWPDGTVDLFYSVAAIQHIPKPYAYNVLLEMQRCLKPGGTAVVQTLSWELLPRQQHITFAQEIKNQISGATTHWHHFYDAQELEAILSYGLRASRKRIETEDVSIWAAWQK